MKHRSAIGLWLALSLFVSGTLKAQSPEEYYVVVGAFAKEVNAKKFTGFVKKRFFKSTYEFNPGRELYYVYAQKSDDKSEAVKLVMTLQQQPEFSDSWVYSKPLPVSNPVAVAQPIPTVEETRPIETQPEPTDSEIKTDSAAVTEVPIVESTTEPEIKKRVVRGKLFKFDIRTPAGEPLIGKVHHVNTKAGKDIATYSNEDYSDVLMPPGPDKNMTLVCGIFGYKEITREVNYINPDKLKGVTRDAEEAWVIPLPLERLESGDESVMYEVAFFKNSVAMQEKSKTDLTELLNMMQSNPRLKIRVDGHANGTKERPITYLESKNYFSQEGAKKKQASALELSKLRAEAVRDYLADQGIDMSRMQVKGFGGKAMIVTETHPASNLNDRIEIKILKD